jgi:hypothetical protein
MKLTLRVEKEEFDKEGWLKALKGAIEQTAQDATNAFAQAALSRIPVHTGFVAGAIYSLAALLDNPQFNPIVTNALKPEFYYPSKTPKNPQTGAAFTSPASADIFRWVGKNYIFNFNVDISYFAIQDTGTGNSPSAPWGAFEAGQVAYINTFEAGLEDRLPKIEEFLRKTTINVS